MTKNNIKLLYKSQKSDPRDQIRTLKRTQAFPEGPQTLLMDPSGLPGTPEGSNKTRDYKKHYAKARKTNNRPPQVAITSPCLSALGPSTAHP